MWRERERKSQVKSQGFLTQGESECFNGTERSQVSERETCI